MFSKRAEPTSPIFTPTFTLSEDFTSKNFHLAVAELALLEKRKRDERNMLEFIRG